MRAVENKRDLIREMHAEGHSRSLAAVLGLIALHRGEAARALETATEGTFRLFQGQIQALDTLEKDIVGKPAPAPSGSGAYSG
jgi:hypothetical protein